MVEKFMFPTTIAIRINPTLSQIQKLCVILQQPATRMDSRDIWSRFLQQNVIAPRCHIDMLEQEVPRSQQISAAHILASSNVGETVKRRNRVFLRPRLEAMLAKV